MSKMKATFEKARKELPITAFGNFDPLVHKTVADLVWCAQHELDMYNEGEEHVITSTAQVTALRKYIAKYS